MNVNFFLDKIFERLKLVCSLRSYVLQSIVLTNTFILNSLYFSKFESIITIFLKVIYLNLIVWNMSRSVINLFTLKNSLFLLVCLGFTIILFRSYRKEDIPSVKKRKKHLFVAVCIIWLVFIAPILMLNLMYWHYPCIICSY